jgi:hypothetical protein
MSLTGKIGATISLKDARTGDLETAVENLLKLANWTVVDGTDAGEADQVWSDRRTLAASDDEDLDLSGVLTNLFGGAVTLAKLKAVAIMAAAGNTNNVVVTRPADTGVPLFLAAGDGIAVLPGGFFLWVAPGDGVTVTAETGDILNIANSAGSTSVTYDVILVGTSA